MDRRGAEPPPCDGFEIRPATTADSALLFEWRNDALTRAMSVSTDPVAWETHAAWFARSLADPNRRIYLVCLVDGDVPAGMCRFDRDADAGSAEVSINLAPMLRGRGLAVPLLRCAIGTFLADGDCRLTATIRHDNVASRKCFEAVGFVEHARDRTFAYFTRATPPR